MKGKLTGWKVAGILLGSFGVVLAVNIFFVVKAVATFPGEDVQRPYLQGLDFNHELARRAEQARLGWQATIAGALDKSGRAHIVVTLVGRDGAPVQKLALRGELRHPADENKDQQVSFKEDGGRYAADIAHVTPGAWDVLVSSSDSHAPFEARRRLWLR